MPQYTGQHEQLIASNRNPTRGDSSDAVYARALSNSRGSHGCRLTTPALGIE